MKKGFTLVELAIVLVIIGLIMGMAIKGKALVNVAKTRAEMAKITQLQAAAATYAAKKNGKIPKNMNDLLSANLITAKNIRSDIEKKDYVLGNCIEFYSLYQLDAKGTFVCIYFGDNPTETRFSQILGCHIEVAFDDMDDRKGLGRVLLPEAASPIGLGKSTDSPNLYEDCDVLLYRGTYTFIVY